jgi:hypothetical protein
MTLIMSFPVPPTQAYMYGWRWLAMMETPTDRGQLMTVDDWYWR